MWARHVEESESQIENKITILYQQLLSLISTEHKKAKSKNKKLMILIGEDHSSLNSHIVELLVLIICEYYFGFKVILEELDEIGYKIMRDNYNERALRYYPFKVWEKCNSFYSFVNELGGEIIPIDLGHCGAKKLPNGEYEVLAYGRVEFDPTSTEGVNYRNKVMHEIAHLKARGNVIAKVGCAHLDGLLNKTDMNNDFHVVTIDATGISMEEFYAMTKLVGLLKDDDKYKECDLFATVIPKFHQEMYIRLTPNRAIELVKNVHKNILLAVEALQSSLTQEDPLFEAQDYHLTEQKVLTYLFEKQGDSSNEKVEAEDEFLSIKEDKALGCTIS